MNDFWKAVTTWWKTILDFTITLKEEYVLFGIPNLQENNDIDFMNLCLLYGKWYIYKCKISQTNLCLLEFIKNVKDKLHTEKAWSDIKQDNIFKDRWEHIYNEL